MPNYSDEELAKFRESLVDFDANESVYADLADDLIAARARIAELEGQVTELRKAVAGTEHKEG
jgi:hypothetical protein